jgi:hypothetical protein
MADPRRTVDPGTIMRQYKALEQREREKRDGKAIADLTPEELRAYKT